MNSIFKYLEFIKEKRIGQFSDTVKITVGFDIVKTKHATDRSDFSKRNLEGDNQTNISNSEMREFVLYFKDEITESILTDKISDNIEFIIKSLDRELSMVIIPVKVSQLYWKLIIKTVFRESEHNTLRVGQNQLVFNK